MARTVFDRLLGIEQGRLLSPVGYDPPEGAHLFVLGSDVAGRFGTIAKGDYAEVFQTGTFGAAEVVRCKARLRGPVVSPGAGLRWVAQLRVDDAIVTERELWTGSTRTLADIAWPVGALAGASHKLSFRLVLLGTGSTSEDIEIPAVYVDALVLDQSFAPRPQLINRIPEANEVRVPTTTTIALDILDVGPSGVSEADTEIYVNGVLAFDGGAFQAGFNGPASSSTSPSSGVRRIVIDPTASFQSEETVAVRVLTKIVGGATVQETIYSFTIEDVTAPRILTAVSVKEKTVRVVFSEDMNPSTMTPGGFLFARAEGAIAVPVVARSVTSNNAREFDITLDQAITPKVVYTLTVSGAKDLSGNLITAPGNSATFIGYACSSPAGRDWDLYSLLPELNRSEDNGDLAKLIAVFQELGDLLLCNIDRFTDTIDPDLAAEGFLDAMLDDLGNPFPFPLAAVDKRRLVRNLVAIYKQKGIAVGIINTIRFFLAIECTITAEGVAPLGLGDWELGVDWVLGSGELSDLLTFIVTTPRALSVTERAHMHQIIEYMKPEREHHKIREPAAPPAVIDHLELGASELGINWTLH